MGCSAFQPRIAKLVGTMNEQFPTTDDRQKRIVGCLIGQAIGDMMGLPYENLSSRAVARRARFDSPSFFLSYGCGSDDTEHAGLTAEAIQQANGDVDRFRRRLASNLRRWFLAGPPGIGLATVRACLKLTIGISPERSGVFSAGNGPAMRAPIIGVMAPPQLLREYVTASTRLTHTDPRAELGSQLIAQLASEAHQIEPQRGDEWIERFLDGLESPADFEPLTQNLRRAAAALRAGRSVLQFAEELTAGRGVSGFIAHTVPVATLAFFRHAEDYRGGVEQVIRAGGDTDTVAAITGGLLGARLGVNRIPVEWLERHRDWPWSLDRLHRIERPALGLWPLMLGRNLVFFLIVLIHLGRRLLPF